MVSNVMVEKKKLVKKELMVNTENVIPVIVINMPLTLSVYGTVLTVKMDFLVMEEIKSPVNLDIMDNSEIVMHVIETSMLIQGGILTTVEIVLETVDVVLNM